MRCGYCHFSADGRRGTDMSPDTARRVIDSIGDYVEKRGTAFKIGFVGGGEPTLREDLLIDSVRRSLEIPGVGAYAITNGLTVSDRLLGFAAENTGRFKLCFSLDGPEGLHDRYRRDAEGRGTFARVMSAVRRYRDAAGTMPAVNCTLHGGSLAHPEELVGFFESEGISDVTFSQIFDCPSLEVSDGEFRAFLDMAGSRLDTRQSRSATGTDCAKYGKRCGAGITNLYFSERGVYPCGRFAGLERYRIGSCGDPLEELEGKLGVVRNPERGCAYDALKIIGEIQ